MKSSIIYDQVKTSLSELQAEVQEPINDNTSSWLQQSNLQVTANNRAIRGIGNLLPIPLVWFSLVCMAVRFWDTVQC